MNFRKVTSHNVDFDGISLTESCLEKCEFKNVKMDFAVIKNCDFTNCSFENIDFRNVQLEDVSFENCKFVNILCIEDQKSLLGYED